jgi:hypothetical protein
VQYPQLALQSPLQSATLRDERRPIVGIHGDIIDERAPEVDVLPGRARPRWTGQAAAGRVTIKFILCA